MANIETSFSDAPPGAVVVECGCSPKGVADGPAPEGCGYLDKPDTVEAPAADFDRIRKPATLDAGTPAQFTFPGGAAPSAAKKYIAEVAGRKVPVVVPDNLPAGKSVPTVQQVASALGAVPARQLDSVKEVVISPNANPSDAYWAQQYNMPGFVSAATGGASGLTFYPLDHPWDQPFVDSTAIHEGGHAYSAALWKDPAVKAKWEAAIASDDLAPSTYAEASSGEDFSESLVMYSLSKGTKCEAPAKARYPERYKTLDAMFK
ncbi:MAG: hypothetical protein ABJD97_04105 [Betaproteobacteria bacterium]